VALEVVEQFFEDLYSGRVYAADDRGIEHYRTADFCEGTLIWQYNDCWPVQSWAVRDSAKQIKPAGWELARLYAPAVLSIVKHEGRAELKAAAHNGGRLPKSLSLRAIDLTTGQVVAEGSDSLDTSSLDSTKVLLWGEADQLVPPEVSTPCRRLQPALELHTLAGCGHCPHDEDSEHFNALLLRWLARTVG